ncbi:hypothetical protein Tco_0238430, partial [Tanacetum coccineum]
DLESSPSLHDKVPVAALEAVNL